MKKKLLTMVCVVIIYSLCQKAAWGEEVKNERNDLVIETKELQIKIQESRKIEKDLQNLSNMLSGTNVGDYLRAKLLKLKEINAQLEKQMETLGLNLQEERANRESPDAALEQKFQEQGVFLEALEKENNSLKQNNIDLKMEIAKLKDTNAQLEKQLKDAEKVRKNMSDLNKAIENSNKENLLLKKENDKLQQNDERLKQQLIQQENNFKYEKAGLYQELGTAYAQAKLYDLAIATYEKGLNLDPDNAQVYYNLGLLYQHVKNDSKSAISHLKKYLELNPEAKNKKEVEYLIKMLTR